MAQDHLTAETFAAWADDALSRDERSAVEAHAADCADCQAMLAAMIRTTPDEAQAAAAPAGWWRAIRWVAPIAVGATAVLVWTIVPARDRQLPDIPETVTAPAPPPPSAAAAQPDASVNAPMPSRTTPEPKAMDKVEASKDVDRDRKEAPTRESATLAKQEAAAAPEAPPPAAAPRAAPQAVDAAAPSENTVAGATPRAAARSFAMAAAAPSPATAILSPNPDVRWRITGAAVERSIDGGSTWQPQQTESTVRLTAGAAPSETVCWLVGEGGTVLLTTDGRTWKRVSFPESGDLVSVTATDETHAKVTVADGRTFTTADAGATWDR